MKKTTTKHKNSPHKKNLLPAQRKSWLKIYSHVAYFLSVLNLFLFPSRVNAAGVPAGTQALEQPLVLVSPLIPRYGYTSYKEAIDLPESSTRCFHISAADRCMAEQCRDGLTAAGCSPGLTAPASLARPSLASNPPQTPR
ncbi:MAG: hypothetical protein ACREOO_31910 [bacterium]